MVSSKKAKIVYDYCTENGEEAASEYFDISIPSVKRYVGLYRQYERDGVREKQDGSVEIISTADTKLTNVFEAMDYGKLDPTSWRPHRVDYNQRADGSLQFKAAFVPIAGDAKESPEAYVQKFVDFVKSYKAPEFNRVMVESENILATISAADWHHGKQVWGKEISGGGENWDIHESRSEFENYIAYSKMRIAPYKPDTIVLELLGDWFNVDSPSNTTVAGTVQSEDSRFIKTQTYAEEMLVDAIESLHEICNKVVVMIVPGNHDATRILMLGRFIQAYYRNDSSIEIMCEPTTRKRIRWGTTLLGYSPEHKRDSIPNRFSLGTKD